jgi:hypothetical protein
MLYKTAFAGVYSGNIKTKGDFIMAIKKAAPANAKEGAKKSAAAKSAADTKPGAKKRGRPAKVK